MTYKEFIIQIQKYYGVYENETVRHDVYEYVKSMYYESELDQLLFNVKKHFSIKWKTQPDIAIFNETEKKYQLIKYINEIRQIPEEYKKQIEPVKDEEDFSGEIGEMWQEMKKNLRSKSSNTDNL
jgi:hypothetical protein